MKLLPRIIVSVIFPMLALAVLALYGASLLMQSALLDEQQERAQATLAQSASRLRLSLIDARDTVRVLAHSSPLATSIGTDAAQVESALRRWEGASERFEAFRFLPLHELAARAAKESLSPSQKKTMTELQNGREVLAEPAISAASGELVMDIAMPVFDARGRQLGALLGSLKLAQLLSFAIGNPAQRDARLMVLDGQARLLAGGLGEDSPDLAPARAASQPQAFAVISALAAQPYSATLRRIAGPQPSYQPVWYALAKPLPELGWRLIYALPEQSLFESASHMRQRGLLGLAVCALLALGGAALLRHFVLRPLMQLRLAQQRLQAGDSHARAAVSGNDEISDLARSFNVMAETLDATEQRFRMIFEAFPHPITLASFHDGNYVDVNPAFAAALGRVAARSHRPQPA